MKNYSYRIMQLADGFHWEVCYSGAAIVEAIEDTLEEAEKAARMVLVLFGESYNGK